MKTKSVRMFGSKAEAKNHGFGVGSKVVRRTQLPTQLASPEEFQQHLEKAEVGEVVGDSERQFWDVRMKNSVMRIHTDALAFIKDEAAPYQKKLRWHGQTVGELREFVQQLGREGVTDDTEFLRVGKDHIAITVPLPLAAEPQGRKLPEVPHLSTRATLDTPRRPNNDDGFDL